MRRIAMGIGALAAAGLIGASAMGAKSPGESAPTKLLAVGAPAPAWSLQDPAGKTHNLADYRGKIVVIDFWATWCGPCKKAMPHMQSLHDKFKDKGVVVFGVSSFERGATAEKVSKPASYMRDQKFTYNLLVNGDDVARAYNVRGIPAFFVIGEDGTVIYADSGFSPAHAAALEKVIASRVGSKG